MVEGWALDGCIPFFGTLGFPFKSPEVRERRWEEHRADLVKRWGPVERMQGWYDYDATPAQRKAFDSAKTPQVWAWRSKHGDDDAVPVRLADVIPVAFAETEE